MTTYSLKYLTFTDYQGNKNVDTLNIAIKFEENKMQVIKKVAEQIHFYIFIQIGEIIDYTFLHSLLYKV